MLFKPRVVLGTLDGKVESDFQPMIRRRNDQPAKVFAGAQLGVNRLVPALGAANGIRTARIVGSGGQGIVRAFAVTAPDRVNRREVQHIEAHVLNHRQSRVHVVKGAMTGRIVGDRAWKQLVPTGKLGDVPFHIQRVFRLRLRKAR